MNEAIQGVQLGLVLALLVGPVFFTIIQTSLQYGMWNSVLLIIGVSMSDLCMIILCYLGLATWVLDSGYRNWIGYGGGILLVIFGLSHILRKSNITPTDRPDPVKARYPVRYLIKGFLINGTTPTVLLFWLATFSLVTVEFGYTGKSQISRFFASLLVTVFATDLLKAWLAGRLRKLVTPKVLRMINIVLGIGLIIFGTRLVFLAAKA